MNTLYERLVQQGILAGATAIVIMEQSKNKVMITGAYPIDRNVVSGNGFEIKELAGINTAAITVHRGSKGTASAWSSLRRFAAEQGYKDIGVYREYYTISAPNPSEQWATELQLPLKK